ncbi:hypothetical protein OTERR_12880 [Oryzomicrobium terrae]|uniref:Phage protein n=1 Tax=Oryzomicrobium terrae TaxID=1735038 RepID=A0A5C1E823_9RHOO|nr:Gp49 family protein [Oryzomicrobium terrae]QEL64764.1 hypothetical protein OTERR_12880 [Oryzomicrobium terrae]
MNDQAIEQEIQAKGLTAPRITPEDIETNIASEHYFTAADGARMSTHGNHPIYNLDTGSLGLLTFCVLVLKNGFTVTGESACASPDNFDAEMGRKIARENAINKVWSLMGYALKDRLANALPTGPVLHTPSGAVFDEVIAAVELADIVALTPKPSQGATDGRSHSPEGIVQGRTYAPEAIEAMEKLLQQPMPLVLAEPELSAAAQDVLDERRRQIEDEGWPPEDDDRYIKRELSAAAECYVGAASARDECPAIWPWAREWWKPSDYRRNLVKAGALILAEIERLDRAEAKKGGAA